MAILHEAEKKATKVGDTGDAVINPDSFIKEVRKLSTQAGIFFNKADKAKLEGL